MSVPSRQTPPASHQFEQAQDYAPEELEEGNNYEDEFEDEYVDPLRALKLLIAGGAQPLELVLFVSTRDTPYMRLWLGI